MTDTGPVRVELRAVRDCPNLSATRDLLSTCLAEAGIEVAIVERIGEYPSPSVLIDGRDVTGADANGPAACVLRPPTRDQIRAALQAARADELSQDELHRTDDDRRPGQAGSGTP
jgi:hypothetical protein